MIPRKPCTVRFEERAGLVTSSGGKAFLVLNIFSIDVLGRRTPTAGQTQQVGPFMIALPQATGGGHEDADFWTTCVVLTNDEHEHFYFHREEEAQQLAACLRAFWKAALEQNRAPIVSSAVLQPEEPSQGPNIANLFPAGDPAQG